jgi:hypothetical protein
MWFIGFPWLTQRRSGILFGMPDDAASIASDMTRHLARPPDSTLRGALLPVVSGG